MPTPAKAPAPAFTGFTPATLKFFQQIGKNNDQDWFTAHREDWLRDVIAPAQAFVTSLGPKLQKLSPGVGYDTDYNGRGSIKKIHTDRRFNPDRQPYKTCLDILFWEGPLPVKKENSGFYFHVQPERVFVAGGMKYFNKDVMKTWRAAASDPKRATALAKLLATMAKEQGYEIRGRNLKKLPRGTDESAPHSELLLHDELYCFYESPVPKEFYGPELVDWCLAHYRKMAPLHRWLVEMLKSV